MKVTDEYTGIDTDGTHPDCRNCGAQLRGAFCHDCGQKAAATHLELREIVHEAADEFFHFDGKILKTLKVLLFYPGKLTKDLIEGHRVRYVTPLRLYVLFSVLYFFLFSVVPGARERSIRVSSTDGAVTTETYNKFADSVSERLPHIHMTVTMPALALFTFIFYRRRQPYFIAHLYYSLHMHSFMFVAVSVSTLGVMLGSTGGLVRAGTFLATVIYHFLGLRNFFGESRLTTAMKGAAIAALYVGAFLVTTIIVVWLSLGDIPRN